jgi:hypothetical protein
MPVDSATIQSASKRVLRAACRVKQSLGLFAREKDHVPLDRLRWRGQERHVPCQDVELDRLNERLFYQAMDEPNGGVRVPVIQHRGVELIELERGELGQWYFADARHQVQANLRLVMVVTLVVKRRAHVFEPLMQVGLHGHAPVGRQHALLEVAQDRTRLAQRLRSSLAEETLALAVGEAGTRLPPPVRAKPDASLAVSTVHIFLLCLTCAYAECRE